MNTLQQLIYENFISMVPFKIKHILVSKINSYSDSDIHVLLHIKKKDG